LSLAKKTTQKWWFTFDGHVKSTAIVIPAKAGIQYYQTVLDSRLRGNDGYERLITFYDFITLGASFFRI
jgi:hypothetical protein